ITRQDDENRRRTRSKKIIRQPTGTGRSSRKESRQNNSSAIVWRDVPSDLIRAPLVDIDWSQAYKNVNISCIKHERKNR
ncbi:hypothetical protein ACFVDF_003234, partial [Salmonella enterica]